MTHVISYEDWEKEQTERLESEDAVCECSECGGWGEIVCDCCGHASDCEVCFGEGAAPISEGGNVCAAATRRKYFDAVVLDIKDLCAWTGGDFLGEMSGFIAKHGRY